VVIVQLPSQKLSCAVHCAHVIIVCVRCSSYAVAPLDIVCLQIPYIHAVFDETHFTKFATWYVTGHYYVDIHPPLAKLVFAWVLQARGFIGAEEEQVEWWYVDMHGFCLPMVLTLSVTFCTTAAL
jgi:dolichyl-phosphate-mannose--protein O-mannosyl transferase